MKTIVRNGFALLLAGLLSTACQREDVSPSSGSADSSRTTATADIDCGTIVFSTSYNFNYRTDIYNPFNCIPQLGFVCVRPGRSFTFPCIYFQIPELILPPTCLSCPPYELAKRIPYYRFPDFRKINPDILKLGENAVIFPLTKSVVGLQFYLENKIINRQVFTLRNNVLLTLNEQKALGVTGKIIPAGNYPVVYNPQNNTFNALVAIK